MNEEGTNIRYFADRLLTDIRDALESAEQLRNESFEQQVKDRAEFIMQILLGMAEKLSVVARQGDRQLKE